MSQTVIDKLSDDQLDECCAGSTDLPMVRRLLNYCLDRESGLVDAFNFSDMFAQNLEAFISEDEGTLAWTEAWTVNQDWGFSIAESVNELLMDAKT